jgi:hypothetical protein
VAGHDAIVNLATHIPGNTQMFLPGAWRMTDRLRREVSAALVDAALAGGAARFVQESSLLVYPDRGDSWIDKSTPTQPLCHSRSVADAEREASGWRPRYPSAREGWPEIVAALPIAS